LEIVLAYIHPMRDVETSTVSETYVRWPLASTQFHLMALDWLSARIPAWTSGVRCIQFPSPRPDEFVSRRLFAKYA